MYQFRSKLPIFCVSKSRFLVGQSLGETETKNRTSLGEILRPIGKSRIVLLLYTVFLPLEPAGSISHRRCFTAGFIGILLNTDAGSIGGQV